MVSINSSSNVTPFPKQNCLPCLLKVRLSLQAPCARCLTNSWSFDRVQNECVKTKLPLAMKEDLSTPIKCQKAVPYLVCFHEAETSSEEGAGLFMEAEKTLPKAHCQIATQH